MARAGAGVAGSVGMKKGYLEEGSLVPSKGGNRKNHGEEVWVTQFLQLWPQLQPLHIFPTPCLARCPQVGLKSVISELELKLEHQVVDNGANFSLVGLLYFLQDMVWIFRAR